MTLRCNISARFKPKIGKMRILALASPATRECVIETERALSHPPKGLHLDTFHASVRRQPLALALEDLQVCNLRLQSFQACFASWPREEKFDSPMHLAGLETLNEDVSLVTPLS